MKLLQKEELLYRCINEIVSSEGENNFSQLFVNAIGNDRHQLVIDELYSLLLKQQGTEGVECKQITTPDACTDNLYARLGTRRGSDGKNKTYYFRLKDAASACAFPIVGVFLALLSENVPGATIQVTKIAQKLWSNLIALHHEEEKEALRVIEAISAIRVKRKGAFQEKLSDEKKFPSTEEIYRHLSDSDVTLEQVLLGLTRLHDIHLIECKHWGNQAGDLSHKSNRWTERA